jgi:putative ABC transport system permease protein
VRTFATVEAVSGQQGRKRLTLLAIGYRAPDGLGGPPLLFSGRTVRGPGEVALDRAAAFRLRVGLADVVLVNGERVRVVGLTRGTNLLATQFLFGDLQAMGGASGVSGHASFLIVRLANGKDSRAVARRIGETFPQASAFVRDDFLANNLREVAAGFVPLIVLLTIVGMAAAAVVVGLLTQGLAEDRRSDIAVLFALGAGPGAVSLGLVAHVEGLVFLGGALGAVLAHALGAILDRALPTIELTYWTSDLAIVLAIFCGSSLLAALIPVLRLRRIDPLEAFRS